MKNTKLFKALSAIKKGADSISPLEFVCAFFGGSTLAKVSVKLAINRFSISKIFFPDLYKVPGFSQTVAASKSADIIEFVFTLAFSFLLFIFLLALASYSSRKTNPLLITPLLIANLILYAETTFLSYSGGRVILSLLLVYSVYGFLKTKRLPDKQVKLNPTRLINGLLMGFYLLILSSALSASVSVPLILFFVTPLIYAAYGTKFEEFSQNPAHLLLLFSAFFSYRFWALLLVGVVFVLSSPILSGLSPKIDFKYLYSFAFVFIVAYNPLFSFGNFDSIEEGFWLGWLQHLLNGEALYKDVAVYHPPGFIWGLYLFTKNVGPSVFALRLYFEILRIMGLFVIFLVTSRIIKHNILKYLVFIVVLVSTQSYVRNNVEIRIALGLLPLVFASMSPKNTKLPRALLPGIFSSIAFFFSLEVGIASFMVCLLNFLFQSFKEKSIKPISYYLSGVVAGSLPFITVLVMTASFTEFLRQLYFYSRAFSAGYLNTPFPPNRGSTLIHWNTVYAYLGSVKCYWELSLFGLISVLFLELKHFLASGSVKSKLVSMMCIYGFLLSRVALGRSDVYHLFFILPLSLMLLAYFLENLSASRSVSLPAFVFIFISIYFFGNYLNQGFLQNQLIKYQSYAKLPGNYPFNDLQRARFAPDIDSDVESEKALISYIQTHVGEDGNIFVYPWGPEIYFLSDRSNATSFDTPLAFFTEEHQEVMVRQLQEKKPAIIVYNPDFRLSALEPATLEEVDGYIKANYSLASEIGNYLILK